jgi:outer membrane protein assembly factor BamB/mono/diheme cytochrome c family protein
LLLFNVSKKGNYVPIRNPGLLLAYFLIVAAALSQTGQWITFSHDPQRSGLAIDEHAFSPGNVSSLGLEWKAVVPNEPLFLTGLSAPLLVRGVKIAGGEKNLVIVAGSSDHVFALDAETGELVWKQDLKITQPRPQDGGWLCPYSLNATPVIDPGKARVFVIASDGRLHTLDLADGHAAIPPAQFVPAFSKMWSLNYAGGVLYTSISQGCAQAASGVAAIDPDAPGRPVTRFFSAANGAGVWGRGGVAVGFDGFIYGVTGDAPFDPAANEFGDTVFKLSPRTLQLAGYYTPSTWEYITRRDLDMGTSTPVVFRWNNRVLTAVGGKEGAIYVTDASDMSGPDHHVAAYISPRYTNATQTFQGAGIWGLMSAWKDTAGQTWLYVPSWGEPTRDARFPTTYGSVTNGSIMAFKVVAAANGKPELKPAWMSSDIAVPDPAAIAGGVLFVLGTGENTEQVKGGDISQLLSGRESLNRGHAILHALDATTGKELWSSRDAMPGWTHFSGLAVGDGKVFATTHDGTVYAFCLRGPGSPAARTTVVPGQPATMAPPRPQAPARPQASAGVVNIPECGAANAAYKQQCAMCHGLDGKGISAARTPNFADPDWQASRSDQALLDALTKGTDKGMPGFEGQLSSAQIDGMIHCLVRGFAQAPQGR